MNRNRLAGVLLALLFALPSIGGAEGLFDQQASQEHFQKGLRHYFQQHYQPAATEFEEAIHINPDDARAYYFLGYSYYRLGQFQQARAAFEQAYEMDPQYSPIPKTTIQE